MILRQPDSNSLNADFHYVPTVHLQNTDRAAVKAYAATAGATATINQATITYTDPAPFTASFSSRGPLRRAAATSSSRTSSPPARTSSRPSRRPATPA